MSPPEEKYAVVQGSLDPMERERLVRAFAATSGVTRIDGSTAFKTANGILMSGLPRDVAERLAASLQREGITCVAAPISAMPALPTPQRMRRVECFDDALLIVDGMDREHPYPWSTVHIIAAGSVSRIELQDRKGADINIQVRADTHNVYQAPPIHGLHSEEIERVAPILELCVGDPLERWRGLSAEMTYAYLGARLQRSAAANFGLLVRDLVAHAPDALTTRGVQAILRGGSFPYNLRGAFEEEITWLLFVQGAPPPPSSGDPA